MTTNRGALLGAGSNEVEPVEVVLTRVAGRWRGVADEITRISLAVRELDGPSDESGRMQEATDAIERLRTAAARFEHAAKRPEVVIATTGTTSSGKSTLANLLIGEALLPKAVQEMSAGVVVVQHDDRVRRVIVEATRGATWPTGSWDELSADEIRAKLESAMHAYRALLLRSSERPNDADSTHDRAQAVDAARTADTVEPPSFRILWPTRMGSRPADFGLPARAQVTIVDLPGLKYVHDEVNGSVVRRHARKALCLVAYNAFETDPRKQEALLEQVVDQVKQLSGSPARMLFALNRIDAFRTEHDPQASERAFAEHVTRQIREGLTKELAEYAEEASKIEPAALSSEPALYGVLAEQAGGEARDALLRKLAKEYALLFPDERMDHLPRNPATWSDDQRRWFFQETRHQSRLESFERRLSEHIAQNLPELILPDLIDDAYASAQHALNELDAFLRGRAMCTEEQAAAMKAELEKAHEALMALKGEALDTLAPLRVVAGGGDLMADLVAAVPKIEAELGLAGPEGTLGKLAAFQSALPDAVQVPLQRLNDYVYRRMDGEAREDSFIQSVAAADALHAAVDALRASPYAKVWKKGGKLEGEEAKLAQTALDTFANALSTTANGLVARESAVQSERMREALRVCEEAVVERLEAKAAAELQRFDFPGLRGVFRGAFELQPPRLGEVRFAADVKTWSHTETKHEREEFFVTERVWWKLWLGTSRVKKTRKTAVTVTTEGVEVAKLGDLLEGFALSGGLATLEQSYAAWLAESIVAFDRTLSDRLGEGARIYRRALEGRRTDVERDTSARVADFQRHRDAVASALASVEVARRWRSALDA